MIKVDIKVRKNQISADIRTMSRALSEFPRELLETLTEFTPEDTGNARRKTRLISRYRIRAAYPYATVLDRGRHQTARGARGSRQAPKGMSRPTRAWARRRIRELTRTRR